MATPRQPEPPNRVGFTGFIFFMGVLGGLVWLLMLIFGWGPYQSGDQAITPTQLSAGITFEVPTPTFSPMASPSETIVPSLTPTFTPTATPELFPFVLDSEPEPVPSVMIRPRLGCDFLIIAGQVWDLEGDPVTGLTLHLYGELGGFTIDRYVLTGAENAVAYGESGYEFALEGLVVDSENTLFIQLVDTNDLPLSLPYTLQTFEDCQRNLILVNFKQVRE